MTFRARSINNAQVRRAAADRCTSPRDKLDRARVAQVLVNRMLEREEDARLNAIADERRDGPFVMVSLDEL